MHRDEIKIALKARGFTVVAFARKLGVSREVIHNVIAGRGRSRRIEAAIATEISKPIWDVFPSRYQSPDAPLTLTSDQAKTVRLALVQATGIIDDARLVELPA
jgi:lambda repressor-like predicted transcriptional regulator